MSLLLISEILQLFVNILTSTLFVIGGIYSNQFNCNYPRNKKFFLGSLLCLWNIHQIFNFLEKKMTLIAYVFPKLWSAKGVARYISMKPRSRTSFHSQHAKGSQRLLKYVRQLIYPILLSLCEKKSWKMSPLVISEILALFVYKYSLCNKEN